MSPSAVEELDVALGERRMLPAEGEEAPVVLEQRAGVALLRVDRHAAGARRHRQPGLAPSRSRHSAWRASHTIGVRQPSRPLNSGQKRMP